MPARVVIPVSVLVERVAGECPACGFDALCRSHAYRLSADGVTQVWDAIYCGRCRAEERRRG
jgi:hypothetical protein